MHNAVDFLLRHGYMVIFVAVSLDGVRSGFPVDTSLSRMAPAWPPQSTGYDVA